jgi:hypothetical protein
MPGKSLSGPNHAVPRQPHLHSANLYAFDVPLTVPVGTLFSHGRQLQAIFKYLGVFRFVNRFVNGFHLIDRMIHE